MTLDVQQNADRLIPQYIGTPAEGLIRALLEITQNEIAEPVNAIKRDFDDLEGYQLDEVGDRMGFDRPRIEDDDLVYFGFAEQDLSFNQGVLATSEPIHFPGIPVNDVTYRRMLRARGIALRGDGSRASITAALQEVSVGPVRLQDRQQMAVRSVPHVLTGMTTFQTSSHNAIVAMGRDGVSTNAFYRIDHVTGLMHRLDVGNWEDVNLSWTGMGVNGRRLLLSSSDGFIGDLGTAWGTNIDAPLVQSQTSRSQDFLLNVARRIYGPLNPSPISPSGQLFFGGGIDVGFACIYEDSNGVRQCAWAEKQLSPIPSFPTVHYAALTYFDGNDNMPFLVTGLTHDYSSAWGRVDNAGNDPGHVFLMNDRGVVGRELTGDNTGVSNPGQFRGGYSVSNEEPYTYNIGAHDAVPDDAVFESITYHEGDFYGSWDSASNGPALFIYATQHAAQPAFEGHIYHPNVHYRNTVTRNIDKLVGTPLGVKLTLHTHAEA